MRCYISSAKWQWIRSTEQSAREFKMQVGKQSADMRNSNVVLREMQHVTNVTRLALLVQLLLPAQWMGATYNTYFA